MGLSIFLEKCKNPREECSMSLIIVNNYINARQTETAEFYLGFTSFYLLQLLPTLYLHFDISPDTHENHHWDYLLKHI